MLHTKYSNIAYSRFSGLLQHPFLNIAKPNYVNYRPGGGTPILTGAGMLIVPLKRLKSWVLVPFRGLKAKYLYLHTARHLLGVPRSIECHFI